MPGLKFPAIALLACAASATADYGEVVDVEPIYGRVAAPVYQERCWQALPRDLASDMRPVRQCEQVAYSTWREELVAYRVAYRYRGRVFTTRTTYHPGDRVRVATGLRPIFF